MKKDLLLPFQQSIAGAPAGKHLLTVSGGVDSMVLAHFYLQAKIPFAIAHCNFQLRGQDSDDDQAFVRHWAQKHQIPFFTTNFNTKAFQEHSKGSTQMAARELRYHWFEALVRVWGFSAIVTAHHLDDQLETFLMQLGRGNGLEGLRGIPQQSGLRLRPLLGISKEELLTYAQTNQLRWREDATNQSNDYKRNALRNTVIPELKAIYPNFLASFEQSLSFLEEGYAHIVQQADDFRLKTFRSEAQGYRVSKKDLQLPEVSSALLHHLFFAFGFKGPEVEKLLVAPSGKFLQNKQASLYSEREDLFLELHPSQTEVIQISDWQSLRALSEPLQWVDTPERLPQQFHASEAYLDKETLKFPLELRNWRRGDYFYPTAFRGRKLLSKLYKDFKYNHTQKENQLLLLSAGQVVWVLGKRLDRRFAATAQTTSIIALKTTAL